MNDVKLRLHLRNALELNLQVLERLLHLIVQRCQLPELVARQFTGRSRLALRTLRSAVSVATWTSAPTSRATLAVNTFTA